MNALASGVAEPVHTWAGRFGALLVLTNHGALLERNATGEWQRLGQFVDGTEAEEIAAKRGYDHVGLDSAAGWSPHYLTLVEEQATEGVTVSVPEERPEGQRPNRRRGEARPVSDEIGWEFERRRELGEKVEAIAKDLAPRLGRKPGGLKLAYGIWRRNQGWTGKRARGQAPHLASVAPLPTSAQRSLLGVAVVEGDHDHDRAVSQLRSFQGELVEAMRSTLRAIPDAKRILELQIEELYRQLEEVEAEGVRITAAAEALGVSLVE